MKILQIIDGLGIGGAEKLIAETVPLLVDKGFIIDVLLLNGERTHLYEELENRQCCRIFSLGNSFYNPLYILKMIPFLKKYDLIHVHLFPAQYFAVFAKLLSFSNTKMLFTEHNTGNTRLNNPIFWMLEKCIYKHYNKIICITSEVYLSLHKKLGIDSEKVEVIENGINLSLIRQSYALERSDFGLNDFDRVLIMVAGFREQKDQDTVIKAMKSLPENYKLLLVGDGIRKDQLQNLVVSLGLENRVLFLGIRTDVNSLLKMSDIAVLSSHWEGFGLAAAEAMACGVPTIASNVPGLAKVVDGGGILFEKGNVTDLMGKILLLEDSQYYDEISIRGIEKSRLYSIDCMIDKLVNLYSKVF